MITLAKNIRKYLTNELSSENDTLFDLIAKRTKVKDNLNKKKSSFLSFITRMETPISICNVGFIAIAVFCLFSGNYSWSILIAFAAVAPLSMILDLATAQERKLQSLNTDQQKEAIRNFTNYQLTLKASSAEKKVSISDFKKFLNEDLPFDWWSSFTKSIKKIEMLENIKTNMNYLDNELYFKDYDKWATQIKENDFNNIYLSELVIIFDLMRETIKNHPIKKSIIRNKIDKLNSDFSKNNIKAIKNELIDMQIKISNNDYLLSKLDKLDEININNNKDSDIYLPSKIGCKENINTSHSLQDKI